MFPVLLQIGDLTVHAYGFFIGLGYIAALLLSSRLARNTGQDSRAVVSLCFYALVFGLIGARVLFVLTELSFFKEHPEEILQIWRGGMVFYGGFFTGMLAVLVYLLVRKLPVFTYLDILAVGLPLGQAFGRIGCLGAGCCHGSLCDLPWAVRLNTDLVDPLLRDKPVHPVQIYESLGLLALTCLLYFFFKRKHPTGAIFLLYCMGYAVLRFFVEFYRGDSIRGFWHSGLSTSQGIALIIFGASVLGWGILVFRRFRSA